MSLTVRSPDVFLDRAAPALAAAAGSLFDIPGETVLGRGRTADVSLARQIAMVAARRADFSLPQVARAFDRNHSTVIYAERVIAAKERKDREIAELLDRLVDGLNAERTALQQTVRDSDATAPNLRAAAAGERERAAAQRAADAAALVVAERDRGAAALRDLANARRELTARAARMEALQRELRAAKARRTGAGRENRIYQQGYRSGRAAERARIAENKRTVGATLIRELVGEYRTMAGDRRTVLLTVRDGQRTLIDRGPDDERLVEQFAGAAQLLAVAAIAGGYLEEARRLGRPVVSRRA